MQITKPQIGRLQTLYSQLCNHEIGMGKDRASRLAWAREHLHKPVTSFGALAPGGAVNLEIDLLARYVARLAEVR